MLKTQRPRPKQQIEKKTSPPQQAGYSRDDLRRDTYVPSRDVLGSPRQHKSANRHG